MGCQIQPRFIRMRDAPDYLGMSKDEFARTARPMLTEVPIGARGVGFDTLDLNAWADEYKRRNGRPKMNGDSKWDVQEREVSSSKQTEQGLSTKSTVESESLPDLVSSRKVKPRGGSKPQLHSDNKKGLSKVQEALNACSQMVLHNT